MVAVTEVLVLGGQRRVWWGNGVQGLAAAHWAMYQPYLRPRSPPRLWPLHLEMWVPLLSGGQQRGGRRDAEGLAQRRAHSRPQSERELLELTDNLMGSGLGHQPVFFSKLLK